MPPEKITVERLDPLSIHDYLAEEILGLPGIGTMLKAIAPKTIADILGVPTPAEIAEAAHKKLRERVEEKVR